MTTQPKSETPRTDVVASEHTEFQAFRTTHYEWSVSVDDYRKLEVYARQLERECAGLRADAERYRWLMSGPETIGTKLRAAMSSYFVAGQFVTRSAAEAAIDEARKAWCDCPIGRCQPDALWHCKNSRRAVQT